MGRKIGFSLVYRDMWQSSGKYVPTVDQLVKVAPHIIAMGCFDRVETNGGGFEQINLLFGENPNTAVREWTKPFNDAGIKTHMLERALNGLRMSPVPADVRKLFFKVKQAQGTNISRSFCGLNDPRNLENSIKFAVEAGMISQAALCVTHSKLHTVEYYIDLADKLIKMGANEICIKDMAGVGRPVSLGKIVKGIKTAHPNIPIQYHSHSGPGFAPASILEVARAGADYIDVAMEPLSWGTGHVDIITARELLHDAGFDVKPINMDEYMKVRQLTQSFMDEFLGYFISDKNRLMNSLLIGSGLPGGMMGSLMSDLQSNLASLNKWKVKNSKPELTEDELLIKLFDEVEFIWPKLGFPPLVTPFSQYVKNVAMMNVMSLEKGQKRWEMIPDSVWEMLLGQMGALPEPLDKEIVDIAIAQGRKFETGNPQDSYPDALPQFEAEMKKNGWDFGKDNEELFELAMHPEQYRAYKSGKAKADFEKELAKCKEDEIKSKAPQATTPVAAEVSIPASFAPKNMIIEVNGEKFEVLVSYGEKGDNKTEKPMTKTVSNEDKGETKTFIAPLEGVFYFTKDSSETAVHVGEVVKPGQLLGYIEAMKTMNALRAEFGGTIVEICKSNGADVEEDDVLFVLK